MRLNQFLARHTGMSRREADKAIEDGRVELNGHPATLGDQVADNDTVALDGQTVETTESITVMLNKPPGYITSRRRQGKSPTIYELLPEELSKLKPIGRLDKDSRGLLLLTNDGKLAQKLTRPKQGKIKVYEVELDKPLEAEDAQQIEDGVEIEDYISRLHLEELGDNRWQVSMTEGKNRQIRRTFEALGYKVVDLFRIRLGRYELGDLGEGEVKEF